MISATVNQSDINNIVKTMNKIVEVTRKKMPTVIKQAMRFACQSAGKDTVPKVRTLGLKHLFRPIVTKAKMAKDGKYLYKYDGDKYFETDNNIPIGRMRREGIEKIAKAIKKWDKKAQTWAFIPYTGNAKGYEQRLKIGKIPGSGAAKMGWLGALKKMGFSFDPQGRNKWPRLSTVTTTKFNDNIFMMVRNEVDYVSKTSGNSATVGIQNADSRLRANYLKEVDNQIQGVCQ